MLHLSLQISLLQRIPALRSPERCQPLMPTAIRSRTRFRHNPLPAPVTLSGTGNQDYLYTPNGGFTGADGFGFTASDSTTSSTEATVTVNVNAKPVASGMIFSTSDIVPYSGTVSATDAEGDAVTFAVVTPPSKGTVTSFDAQSGSFTYTPDPSQDGPDAFGITATDGFQTSDEAVVGLEIFKWVGNQQFGTASEDFAVTMGIHPMTDGGFVFGGITDGAIASSPSAGQTDGWLRRVDRRGNEVWTIQFGGSDRDFPRIIMPDPDGSGIFVVTTLSDVGGGVIYKFDNDGNELFSTSIDFLGANITLSASPYWGGVDPDGDLILLSWLGSSSSAITKIRGSDGTTIWQQTLEGTLEPGATTPFNADWASIRLRGVDFDGANNLIIVGNYKPAPTAVRPCSDCNVFLNYSPNGTLFITTEVNDFSNACQSSNETRIFRVTVAPDQSLWAVGWGGFADSVGQVSRFRNFLASQPLWNYCDVTGAIDIFNFTAAQITASGDGLVLSELRSIDPTTSLREGELLVTRLDDDGNVVFRRTIEVNRLDGSKAAITSGSVVEHADGSIFVTGATDGDFVSGASVGGNDALLLRLDAAGNT